MSDSPDQALALARSAAEAIRGLSHATLGGDGLDQPADAYSVLGELSQAASMLPQLLGQVGRWLAAALARDLGQAQQQLAAVNGGPSQEGERS